VAGGQWRQAASLVLSFKKFNDAWAYKNVFLFKTSFVLDERTYSYCKSPNGMRRASNNR
jgi:hypothetical protein